MKHPLRPLARGLVAASTLLLAHAYAAETSVSVPVGEAHVSLIDSDSKGGGRQTDVYRITNNSTAIIDTHLLLVARGTRNHLENASGVTSTGDPYQRVFLPDGALLPGQSVVMALHFRRQHHDPRVNYRLVLLSGQGNP